MSSPQLQSSSGSLDSAPPSLVAALTRRGFTELTPVQEAVAQAEGNRDLRMASQTGSGKTVAYGMAVLINAIGSPETRPSKRKLTEATTSSKHVRVVVLCPTRELAQQVAQELAWLYQDVKLKVVAVYGGTSVRLDHRVLSGGVDVLVATPGRLCDHVRTGAVDLSKARALVLDEADEMLAMGFKEEVDEIVKAVPASRRTVLVSATFPRAVEDLAHRIQRDPVFVRGAAQTGGHADIEHIVHIVPMGDREAAVINLLLMAPDVTTLLFLRTRESAAIYADGLAGEGFTCELLSGEMDQKARTRALANFKEGRVKILVATDVAARGLDVQDIGRVIHVDPPDDPDSYTHRSGRTGRAGKKGESILLVPPGKRPRVAATLDRARAKFVIKPIPTEAEVDQAQRRTLLDNLLKDLEESEGEETKPSAEAVELAKAGLARTLVAKLFERLHVQSRITKPRYVTPIIPPARGSRPGRAEYGERESYGDRRERTDRGSSYDRSASHDRGVTHDRGERAPRGEGRSYESSDAFSLFHVTWGTKTGATAQRLLALVCRRGQIQSRDVGAIRLGPQASTVEVRAGVAAEFAVHAREPDERDARVKIAPLTTKPPETAYTTGNTADRNRAVGARPASPTGDRPKSYGAKPYGKKPYGSKEQGGGQPPRKHAPR